MFASIRVFLFDESGATAIEYGLITALVSLAGVAAFSSMGSSLTSIFSYISGLMNAAT